RPGPDGKVTAVEARRAATHFQRAVAADPRHALAAFNLTECLLGMEDVKVAVQGAGLLMASLARGGVLPDRLDGPVFPGTSEVLRAEWEKAAWDNASDKDAEHEAKLALLRWRLHAHLGRLTGELAHFHEAALARPDLAPSRLALGLALGQVKRDADALVHLRAA